MTQTGDKTPQVTFYKQFYFMEHLAMIPIGSSVGSLALVIWEIDYSNPIMVRRGRIMTLKALVW